MQAHDKSKWKMGEKGNAVQNILFGTQKWWCWHLLLLFASQRNSSNCTEFKWFQKNSAVTEGQVD